MTKVGNLYKVQVGAYSVKSNADAQLNRLKAAGFSDAFITTANGGTVVATTPAATKTVEELAREVIAGKWGNGEARKKALTEAGYDYSAVQARVNSILA
ncbi:MAG: SPOR domain-containing protein [Lachnospiraceae bacterium]|nr:SPOR domain-containing protein [Lachnospiraceae bacterium]